MARILLIEDEDNIALPLEYLLTRGGHNYTRLATGRNAVATIRDLMPDLVLLDVMLPDVSGYQIVQDLRADAFFKDVRILLMTARGSLVERRKGLALGADGFIAKPFELAELRAEIDKLISDAAAE